MIGPEQNYAVKGRSIPDNLNLVHEVLERLEDNTKAILINSDQAKSFDRMDHWFLVTVLETARFKLEFHKWISMMYQNLQAVVQVNGKYLEVFMIKQLVQQGCTWSSLLYVLALELLPCRLKAEVVNQAMHRVPIAGGFSLCICWCGWKVQRSSRNQDQFW